jgi:hypothetical protein
MWGSKGSVTPILPIGEPMQDTVMPYLSSIARASLTIESSKSDTLTPQALRSSMQPMPSRCSVWH